MTLKHWTDGLHHDGSEVYISNPIPALGETITIKLRVPKNTPIKTIWLRTAPDGEKHLDQMKVIDTNTVSAIWATELKITMPLTTYRFQILTEEGTYYLNQYGVSRANRPDHWDFKLIADFITPSWLDNAIFYQIFPDRFHNGDASLNVEDGAWERKGYTVQFREWNKHPLPYQESGNLDFYGGDLVGIQQKIDYLKTLGINAIYLNPIFESLSNHRYNIKDFYKVDKHLGGNDALAKLSQTLHDNDMRLILDMTPNHSAATHPWFLEAQADENAPSAEYYTFYERPDNYEAWLNVPSLPKLNYASDKLRDKMYRDEDSILQYWLSAPYNIDGWRLDVANMTARQGKHQYAHEVWREMRQEIKPDYPEAYIFGEDFFDGTPYLQGDELDGSMNYQGFNMPTWRWLSGYDSAIHHRPEFADRIPLPSEVYDEQLRNFRSVIPWAIARQQFNQLCSHDTDRIYNIVNHDRDLLKLGVAMVMTYVGVPCIYYGDEVGLVGSKDPDNRRTMPWNEEKWETDILDWYKQLIHLRKTAPALLHGGYQTLYAQGDIFAFMRQSNQQTLIIIGHRGDNTIQQLQLPIEHAGIANDTELVNIIADTPPIKVSNGNITLENVPHGGVYILEVR